MPMALSAPARGVVVLSALVIPVLTYLYLTRIQRKTPSSASAGPLPPPTKITALYIHPIKSCHGISVQSACLLPTGLDLDRHWMWVSYPSHEFLTIRNNPRMTLIRPSYDAETDTLTVTAPSPDSDTELSFTIPAHPTPSYLAKNTTIHPAKIWSQHTPTHVFPASLTDAFTPFFGTAIRLVYKPPISTTLTPRPLRSNGAPHLLGRTASTCFPDLMPLLICSAASLAELNARLGPGAEIGVTRFRPNILVEGDTDEPWDEDRWKTVCIDTSTPDDSSNGQEKTTLDLTQRCARCRVPNVDPDTGEQDKREPWNTLMSYRRVDSGIKYKPCFGMLGVPREGGLGEGKMIRVGMTLRVTEVTGTHCYVAGF